jgi:ABC-2 type transport system ATP-binding protein
MVQVNSVHKLFGAVHAVRGVSFELASGQATGLLGHNGAGKTTTLRMIAGYLAPDSGSVRIDGHDTVRERARAAARLGYLPESTPLYTEMSAEEYLDFRGRLHGKGRAQRRADVERAIERCWLRDVRSRRIGTLSKGYKQRIGLAAALLHNPPVLLLDEPTNGLDPTQVRETRGLVRELAERRCVLVSSHILSEVERLCDRVIIIMGGEVRADGSPAQLASLAGSGAVTLEGHCADDALAERFLSALRSLEGVESVSHTRIDGAWRSWRVAQRAGDVREGVARAAALHGVLLRELRAEAPSLERVFQNAAELAANTGTGSTP